MMPDEQRLEALLSAVADGFPLDWAGAESAAETPADRGLVRQLRVLADLAAVHRRGHSDEHASPPPSPSPDESTRDSGEPRQWAHLQILERAGAGTFGRVYRAWDSRLDREVALKILLADTRASADRLSHVIEEGRLLARVRHPNVITVYGADRVDGKVGLWMEFIHGRTLKQVLAQQGPFGAREAALVGVDLCRALAAVHQTGLVHRDIKPQNVMREDGGRIVLMDFGAGWDRHALSAGGPDRLTGTPLYMAPELFDGREATPPSDLYALGVLLYHLVTGDYPVKGDSLGDMALAHARRARQWLRDARPDLPAAFVRVVERIVSPAPADRYQSAGAVEAALTEALDVRPGRKARRSDVRGETAVTTAAAGAEGDTLPDAEPAGSAVPLRRPRFRLATYLPVAAAIAITAGAAAAIGLNQDRVKRFIGLAPASAIRSIAVLPLVNLSQDPRQEFLADGMTDGVINTLGRLRKLRVTARTSVMPFKGSRKSVAEIATALNVDTVLEGSVVLAAAASGVESARVSFNLIDPRTQTLIWSASVERSLGDVLSIHGEITRTIAERIDLTLTPDEQKTLSRSQAVDPDAYKLYLLGRQAFATRVLPGMNRAVAYFEQSIARAPAYAAPHSGLADVYVLMTGDLGALPREEGAAKAIASASKALEIDPTLAEAHTSLAFANFFLNWNWEIAETGFNRALQLNPSYATAHHWYGNFLSDMGREEEGLIQMREAHALDPLSAIISRDVAWPLFFSGRYEEAIQHLRQTLVEHEGFLPAERLIARSHAQRGQFDEAILRFTAINERHENARDRCELAWTYALAGRHDDAVRELATILERPPSRVYRYDLAFVYTALGRREEALTELERAYAEHDPTMVNLKHDPRLKALRTEPRFGELLTRMKFPSTDR